MPLPALNVLEDPRVRFVRIMWVDLINFVRYRVVPIAHFRMLVTGFREKGSEAISVVTDDSGGLRYNGNGGIQLGKVALGIAFLALADGFSATGEYVYVPDLTSARLLSYAPGHASVLGWFEEKEAEASPRSHSFAATLCPRGLLRRIVEEVKKTDGVEFLIGFETEVVFLSSIDPIQAVNDYGWSESPAICAGSTEARVLEEIADALEEAGVELQMYHAEAAPGQFEIVTGPLPPLQACDALVTTREIIMNIAAKHGLRATLAPRIFSNSCGSAAHTHISLTSSSPTWPSMPTPVSVSSPPSVSLTSLQSSFLAGLLAHLPAALALTLPTRASYARMTDGAWSGGTWVAWGRDNREAPVRLAGRGVGRGPEHRRVGPDYHFEIKPIDGTSSPYLAVSALLASGISGIRARLPLTSTGLHRAPSEMTAEERKAYGVTTRMPLTLDEARATLEADGVLQSVLGEEFVKAYLSVNKTLDEQLQAPTPEEAMVKLIKTF